jgi:hypothetical protein
LTETAEVTTALSAAEDVQNTVVAAVIVEGAVELSEEGEGGIALCARERLRGRMQPNGFAAEEGQFDVIAEGQRWLLAEEPQIDCVLEAVQIDC